MISEVGSRIAKNSTFNVLRTLISVPILLFITPYIIRHLGKEEFGIWALVGVVSSYAQLSDFGITESLIKFMAEFKAREETIRLNQLINTAMTVYLLLGVIVCGVFITLIPFIVERILNIPSALSAQALYVFTFAILLFFLNMLMGVFGSLILGFQRMGYSNTIALCSTILNACGTYLFLLNGYGLKGLMYNNAIITGFVVCANTFVAWYLFPTMRINPFRYFNLDVLRQIFSFSWKVQVSNITQLMIFQLDRVLLSHYVGLTAVSHYEIANRIASQARGVIASIFSPMVPAASTLQVSAEKDKVTGLYRRSFKYMAVVAIPSSLLIIALAHPFVRIWMGPNYETSAFTMQLLMATYMLNLLTGPGAFILSGINKPQIGMRSSMIAGVTNLCLCILLVQVMGYYGVIIGIFTSIITSGVFFIWMVHQNIEGLSWGLYPKTLVKPLLLSFLFGGALIAINVIIPLDGYYLLCLFGGGYLLLVFFGLSQGTYFDKFDRGMIAKLTPWQRVKV